MTTPPKDNTPDKLDIFISDYRDNQHICQDEGYGCEYEQFTAYGRENTRCKLLRESDDSLKQKLRDYIAREIDAVLGDKIKLTYKGNPVDEDKPVPIDIMNDTRDSLLFIQENGKFTLQNEQIKRAANRGWRIES